MGSFIYQVFSTDPRVLTRAREKFEVNNRQELIDAVERLFLLAENGKHEPEATWLREAEELSERVGKPWSSLRLVPPQSSGSSGHSERLHTQACLEYAAKTRLAYCIIECSDARIACERAKLCEPDALWSGSYDGGLRIMHEPPVERLESSRNAWNGNDEMAIFVANANLTRRA